MKTLSDRQRQCILLSATMTDKEIGRELGVSPGTVNKHIQEAMERLGVNSRKSALRALGYATPPAPDPLPSGLVTAPNEGAETDSDTPSRKSRSSALPLYSPPPRGTGVRLAIVFAFFIAGSIVAIGSAAVVNAGLDLAQQMAPTDAR